MSALSQETNVYPVLSEERKKELKDAFVNIHTHSFYSLLF